MNGNEASVKQESPEFIQESVNQTQATSTMPLQVTA
jgi:hypothetical protein